MKLMGIEGRFSCAEMNRNRLKTMRSQRAESKKKHHSYELEIDESIVLISEGALI